jgi:hypothetical protein
MACAWLVISHRDQAQPSAIDLMENVVEQCVSLLGQRALPWLWHVAMTRPGYTKNKDYQYYNIKP